jgi:hypothetical protein
MDFWLKFKAQIIALGAGLVALVGIYWAGKRSGAKDERIEQERADAEQARRIQDVADRARRADGDNLPPVERLQRAKRIRDL